ncbi:MAG TPA: serine/threonine-protein kinase, partial [Thermoanaerobaculia bacterium]
MSTPDPDQTARVETDVRLTPRTPHGDAQFAPGAIIAGRYRIGGLLGSGGMGEVYRADDIKLDQQVALKFLPARLAKDQLLLMRLHDEVRLGRQIAHPNVCRIYDIGEFEETHFVAMEYVDGEDLRRLLSRIGRLASDKAVEIARGIAAGLHAAHAKGILHRDLKPANVMLDSRGHARITDFGLALSTDTAEFGGIAGTPAYMAPEQLAGKPASVQSDLYSLGLLMYELFTGRHAFRAVTVPELRREQSSTEITTPSSLIRDLDPAVERVMLRCLDPDPSKRPRSAREVIDALPGGDPLAAALAAGETPSPRIVAAAGAEGSLKPAIAWTLLLSIVAMLAAIVFVRRTDSLGSLLDLRTPPEVHEDRARTLLARLGLPSDETLIGELRENREYLAWIEVEKRWHEWQRLRHGIPAATYWLYRPDRKSLLRTGAPEPFPKRASGVESMEVDFRGRLFSLRALPDATWPAKPLDWKPLLASAGFDVATLTAAAPQTLPAGPFDARAAWNGNHPDDGRPLHIEAAAWRGTPVFFRVTGPWADPTLLEKVPFGGTGFTIGMFAFFGTMIGLLALLGWRNVRLRRGDRVGAARVAAGGFVATMLVDVLANDHFGDPMHEVGLLQESLRNALLGAAVLYVLYLAVEPFIRRRWPDTLIGWARLVAGNVRDPMVGRDLLIGIAAGVFHAILASYGHVLREALPGRRSEPLLTEMSIGMLSRFRYAVAGILSASYTGVVWGFIMVGVVVLLTMIFRRRAIGVAGLTITLLTFFVAATG